jgi:mannose-6-phosphate isomerase-like protein (cupin superfamily)
MKKIVFCLFIFPITLLAQKQDLKNIKVHKDSFENVKVVSLHSDEQTSAFVVFVKKEVALHKHEHHTEIVSVLEGKGIMTLGDETFEIKKGDFFIIPKGMPHSVQTTSKKPLKALSIQAPKFEGKDRIFLN